MAKFDPIHLQKYLGGVEYPVRKADLLAHAKRNGADAEVCRLLERLPDESFAAPVDVSQAVGRLA